MCLPGGEDVENPAKRSAAADPQAGSDDEPDDRPEKSSVVNLADTGEDDAEDSRNAGVFDFGFSAHLFWCCQVGIHGRDYTCR